MASKVTSIFAHFFCGPMLRIGFGFGGVRRQPSGHEPKGASMKWPEGGKIKAIKQLWYG